MGYDFEIIYKKGKKNVVADALSIKDEDVEASFCAISIIQLDWINEVRDERKKDEEVWPLIQKLQKILVQTILLELDKEGKIILEPGADTKKKNLTSMKLINFRVSHQVEELTY